MSYAALGDLVKQQHPEYQSVDSASLGQSFIQKNPQYHAWADQPSLPLPGGAGQLPLPTPQAPAQPQPASTGTKALSAVQKVGGFLGLNGLANGASQAIGSALGIGAPDPQQAANANSVQSVLQQEAQHAKQTGNTAQLQKISQVMGQSDQTPNQENILSGGHGFTTNGQVAGSALQTAGSILGAGALPGTSTLPGMIAAGGLLGATGGAGNALQNNASAQGVGKATLEGGALGGALPLAGAAIGKGLSAVANAGSNAIYSNVVGTPLRQALRGTDNSGFLQQEGITGGYGKIGDKLAALKESVGNTIGGIIGEHGGKTVDLSGTLNDLMKHRSDLEAIGQSTGQVDNAIQAIQTAAKNSLGGDTEMSVADAQALKQKYGQFIGKKFESTDPFTQAVNKKAYGGLDGALDSTLKDTGYTKANSKYSAIRNAMDAVEARQVQQPGKFSQAADLVSGITALAHPLAGGAMIGASKVIQSPTFGTPIGQMLYKAAQAGNPQASALLQRLATSGVTQATGPKASTQ